MKNMILSVLIFESFIRSPEHIMEIYIPEKPLLQAASALIFEINCAIATLRNIALERDIKSFAMVQLV